MTDVLTVVHEVKDFGNWKKGYDADAPNRKAAGLTDAVLTRLDGNPNVVALVFTVSDAQKARAMIASPALRATMQNAGVLGTPDVHFRQGEISQPDAAQLLTLNCRIRDIDTFRKGYAMDKADRVAATLTDLALLQDVDDPNDLLLVWALEDVARVKKFIESPALAEHQVKNAGIVGKPLLRFWKK